MLDRQKNKQALAAVEHETSCIRTQLGESMQKNATLNADVEAATLVAAKLQDDFKVALERESAEAATAKKSFEEEIARLRAEISANPAPDEKCSLPHFVFHSFYFFKTHWCMHAPIAWAVLHGHTSKAKTFLKITTRLSSSLEGAHPSSAHTAN